LHGRGGAARARGGGGDGRAGEPRGALGAKPRPDRRVHAGRPGPERPMSANLGPAQTRAAGRVLEMRRASRVHGQGPRTVRALVDADLVLHAGEFVAVMGPSGSGKSTLLHLAGGLHATTSGQELADGTDLANLNLAARAVLLRRA